MQTTSRTSSERLLYVQFTSCVYEINASALIFFCLILVKGFADGPAESLSDDKRNEIGEEKHIKNRKVFSTLASIYNDVFSVKVVT